MKILVTGANGQLGTTFKNNKGNPYDYIFCNKNDLNFLDKNQIILFLNQINPNIIINCAAYTAVDEAENNENIASAINFEAVELISKWCKQNNCFLIHFSTDYVFDGKKQTAYFESDLPNPLSVYGKTKYLGEQAFVKSNCAGICLRTSWVHSRYGKNFYLTIKKLFVKNQTVKIIDDQFGIPTTTDFLVKTTNTIIDKKIKKIELPKILHAVPSNFTNWYEFGKIIFKNLNNIKNYKNIMNCKEIVPIKTFEYNQTAERPKFSVLSNNNLKKLIDNEIKSWLTEHNSIY